MAINLTNSFVRPMKPTDQIAGVAWGLLFPTQNPTNENLNTEQSYKSSSDYCAKQIHRLIFETNRDVWLKLRQNPDYQFNADIYSCVILGLFASIIILLMVTILLNSMRVRVEYEDNARQRQKLREAKQKVQRWLVEAKIRGAKRLSFRRSHSNSESASAEAFFGINFTSMESTARTPSRLSRNESSSIRTSKQHSIVSTQLSTTSSISVPTYRKEAQQLNKTYNSNDPPQIRHRPSPLKLSLSDINHASCSTTPTPNAAAFASASVTATLGLVRQFGMDSFKNNQSYSRMNGSTNSFHFLPEIIVHCHDDDPTVDDSSSSRQFSRASSSQSIDETSSLSQSENGLYFDA